MSQKKAVEGLFDAFLFIFVPAVVYTMAALNWILDPFFLRARTVARQLPELARFPSTTSRKLAQFLARGGSVFLQIGIALVSVTGIAFIWHHWQDHMALAGDSAPMRWLIAALSILVGVWFIAWCEFLRITLLREPTRRAIRRRLNRIGLLTCVNCGRSLKGLTSGVCPECHGRAE